MKEEKDGEREEEEENECVVVKPFDGIDDLFGMRHPLSTPEPIIKHS